MVGDGETKDSKNPEALASGLSLGEPDLLGFTIRAPDRAIDWHEGKGKTMGNQVNR